MSLVSGRVLPILVVLAGILLVSMLGCGYVEVDEEAALLEPPSVRSIIDEADELGLEPADLLERRRRAAIEDLEEIYEERIDDASGDRAVARLERQLERQTDKLNSNYDRRLERLEDRLDRDG